MRCWQIKAPLLLPAIMARINESTSEINTFHSHNPVPFILGAPQFDNQPRILNIGILGDVGPTILKLMGLPIPGEMTGRVLI